MINIYHYSPGHYDLLQADTEVTAEDLQEYLSFGNTVLFSLIEEKKKILIGIVGGVQVRKGVLEAWMVPSIHVKKYKISFMRALHRVLYYVASELKLRRIQMTIDDKRNAKWAESLGFEFEAELKDYGHNREPEWLYARTYTWPKQPH